MTCIGYVEARGARYELAARAARTEALRRARGEAARQRAVRPRRRAARLAAWALGKAGGIGWPRARPVRPGAPG